MNKESTFALAIEAYYKVCQNGTPVFDNDGNMYSGLIFQQPDVSSCTISWKYVHLRNCNGEFARYVIKTGEIMI